MNSRLSVYRGKVKPRNKVRHWARGMDLCLERFDFQGKSNNRCEQGEMPMVSDKEEGENYQRRQKSASRAHPHRAM